VGADDHVASWLADGRRCFPGVELDAAVFRAAVAPHVADLAGADEVFGADLFLAVACARGDEEALRRFDGDYLSKIAQWLKLPPTDQEIVTEVRQRVATRALVGKDGAAARIAHYAGRGPLWAWVRIIALREHARLRQEQARHPTSAGTDDDELDQLARSGELSADLRALRARYQEAMMGAFRAAISALPPRDRTLLRLAYVDGLSLESVGRMYGVNKSTVSRWLAGCRAEILSAAAERLRGELGLPADDVESLLGVMHRDLDVSLDGLLRA